MATRDKDVLERAARLSPLLRAAGYSDADALLNPRPSQDFAFGRDLYEETHPQVSRAIAMEDTPPISGLGYNVPVPGDGGAVWSKVGLNPEGTSSRSVRKTDVFLEEPQFQGAYNTAVMAPVVQEQLKSLRDQERLLAMEAEQTPDFVSAPIAGLLEAEFGRKASTLARGGGVTPEEQRDRLTRGLLSIQQGKKQAGQTISDLIEKQKGGQQVDQVETESPLTSANSKAMARESRLASQDFENRLEKHQKRMAGLENTQSVLEEVNNAIPGGIREWSGKDIPGSGQTQLLPDALLSTKGVQFKQAFANIENVLTHEMAGSALTANELARVQKEYGSAKGAGDREKIIFLRRFSDLLGKKAVQAQTAAPKDVIEVYQERGGRRANNFGKFASAPKKKTSGKKNPAQMTEAELDAFLAEHGE
jgi:hypothetical protein